MLIIPAIDIKDGKCVRLLKGEEGTETVFSENPSQVAKRWEDYGAEWIHVVDLDGAFSGAPKNLDLIQEIVGSVLCPIQVGGGVRKLEIVENYIEIGVSRVIIGTAAFKSKSPQFLSKACEKFAGKVAVGIDTRNGKVAIKGWKETMDLTPGTVLADLQTAGVSLVIHTNVDRDGTMEGVNLEASRDFVDSSSIPVIESGGIASMQDIERLSSLEDSGLVGVILGRSIYTGKINLEEAIKRFS